MKPDCDRFRAFKFNKKEDGSDVNSQAVIDICFAEIKAVKKHRSKKKRQENETGGS